MTGRKREDIRLKFGRRIRTLREQRGWSQEKLAEMAGLHRTYVGAIERGERNVALLNIERIAQAFDMTISDLFNALL
ncbi:MAG TPA: helix-turn-helix transcriptional regulator [Blastocatellia bacterium]|nr:helix-turn-helix transcriptional regulator [Blastocatellia bacterium]